MVWLNAQIKAEDQLRQRVAWALSQIFVINVDGVGRTQETELYANYYDIFVRNAFGNYRDVMREVSFSAVMGAMLSFTYTKSIGYVTPFLYAYLVQTLSCVRHPLTKSIGCVIPFHYSYLLQACSW